jgi:hypothetical protein
MVCGWWLTRQHVKAGAADQSLIQRLDQVLLVDETTAGGIKAVLRRY